MRRTERAAIIAAAVYILLAIALLLSAVLLARSVTLLAGGVQTVVRAAACFMVFLGLRLSRRRSADFPLGLYKLENLVSVIVGFFILFSAYETAKEALRLMGPESEGLSDVWIPIVILVVCAALAGVLAWYKWHVGKRENSPSLKAEARHSLGSMCACLLLALGLGLEKAGVPDMGAVVALLVVALLVWFGVTISLDGLKVLLDASVEKDVLEKVRSIAEDDDRVRQVFEVEGRNSGSFRFVDLNLTLATHDLREATAVSREIEDRDTGGDRQCRPCHGGILARDLAKVDVRGAPRGRQRSPFPRPVAGATTGHRGYRLEWTEGVFTTDHRCPL